MNIKRAFPKNLLALRNQLGWTQTKLAKRAGISQDWLSHLECGRRMPSLAVLTRLVRALHTTSDYLLGLK